MRLRILSDIHLELVYKNHCQYMRSFIPKSRCPDTVLMLAGDIGNPTSKLYRRFLTEIAPFYDKVFIVTGNHEYYQRGNQVYDRDEKCLVRTTDYSMSELDTMITDFVATLPNVHFLQRTSVVHNRVRFLGCTLWTLAAGTLTSLMNDYQFINNFTADRCTTLHYRDACWLDEQLSLTSPDYDRTVVMTHHLPSYKLIHPNYRDEITNIFYASHSDHLVGQADIWICGHSHRPIRMKIGDCWCYRNPVGYQIETTGYDPNFTVEVLPVNTTNKQ